MQVFRKILKLIAELKSLTLNFTLDGNINIDISEECAKIKEVIEKSVSSDYFRLSSEGFKLMGEFFRVIRV